MEKYKVEVAVLYPDHTWDSRLVEVEAGSILDAEHRAEHKVMSVFDKEGVEITNTVVLSVLDE